MAKVIEEPKSSDLVERLGAAPKVPAGFWGRVCFHYQSGQPIFVEVTETAKIERPS